MSQQIYLPFGGQYTIPYEFDADTMQVPRGQSSVLWELRDGNLTAAEAMIYLFLNHGQHLEFRSNVVYVESLSVKETWGRDVAEIRERDISEPQ